MKSYNLKKIYSFLSDFAKFTKIWTNKWLIFTCFIHLKATIKAGNR